MADIVTFGQPALLEAARALGAPLIVSRDAVVTVLELLSAGVISPAEAQAWASFIRWGYVAPSVGGPIRSLTIEYDNEWDLEIAHTVSRLDEIGDIVDGEIGPGEIAGLLRSLGASAGS